MSEMNALQNEYAQAATAQHYQKIADAIRDVDIQIANLNGDTAKARILEVNKQVEELTRRLTELGEAPDRVTKKAQELRAALNLQSQIKDAQAAADFYRELAQLSGNYGRSQEYVDQLLSLQADNLIRNVGITRELADEWLRLQKIQNSREAWAGAYRATQEYFSEATNLAQGFEQATTNMLDGISGAFQITTDGLVVNWNNAMTTMANDFLQIFMRNIVGNIANSGMDWLGSFFNSTFNGLTKSAASGAAATSGYAGMGFRYSGGSALGNVFSGGDLSLYRNSIVSSPTFFTHDRHISRYAKGAGLMGEAGPEAVMPLVRTSGGNLGVRAEGTGNITPQINIQVINQTGTNATAEVQQQRNAQGGMDVVVLLKREMASDIARGGVLDQTIRGRYGVKPVVRGR